jgi:hypothetical protein
MVGLKHSINQQKLEKSGMEKSVYMNHAQKIMNLLDMEEERESIVLSLVQLYKILIKDSKTEPNVQELFQDRILEFTEEFDHPSLVLRDEKLTLAKLLEENADALIKSEKYHVDVMAANKYIKAASVFLEYNKNADMKKMLNKALKCSKHGQFEKFGFRKIIRPPRAKDKDGIEINPDPDNTDKKIKEYLEFLLQALEKK